MVLKKIKNKDGGKCGIVRTNSNEPKQAYPGLPGVEEPGFMRKVVLQGPKAFYH